MEQIKSLNGMVQHLLKLGVNKRIAVAVAEDDNTIKSLFKVKKSQIKHYFFIQQLN
ncbi:hypothetical protein [Carboxylicivirga sp. N1Y90]|uniref:hypothetical protein n=1 Tax=Carboxylicivirga fragile TaxID=3417571 RepID=UPI003D342FD9|nr:hypothetical protein [Marinilabiliaceae bacterium N1Y90]